jgi:hypothetical protein
VLLQRLLQLLQLALLLLRHQLRAAELAPQRRQLGAQDPRFAAWARTGQRCRQTGNRQLGPSRLLPGG